MLLAGCGNKQHNINEAGIRTNAPVVYIHPLYDNTAKSAVAVVPFQVADGIDITLSKRVAALFRDVMLGKRAFTTVKLVDTPYTSIAEAINIGHRAGTDLVLAGRVNYVMTGTRMGGARVDVSIRLLDVKSGDTIWYIEQTMDQQMDYPDVSVLHRLASVFSVPEIRQSEAAPSVPNMLAHIAVNMADVMAGERTVDRM
jgi:methylglyoxal synthase